MRSRIVSALLLGGTLILTACATSEEWAEWRKHPSHFASGRHMGFSLRHTEGAAPRVTRRDMETARAETWWGKTITVSAEQIFQD
ncbi:MAG: hypothetical protein HY726_19700 [Candidatus Rokubacteria bacterium]|nr:hypothetical protein [Candidatus Rokubacteria bacterium]